MAFINLKKPIYNELERIAKNNNCTVADIAHDSINFYRNYLKFVSDEKDILKMLDNLNKSNVDINAKIKELNTVKESLSNYFFKEINQTIIKMEAELK